MRLRTASGNSESAGKDFWGDGRAVAVSVDAFGRSLCVKFRFESFVLVARRPWEAIPQGETILLSGQQGPAYFLVPVLGDVVMEDRELRRAMAKASLRESWVHAKASGWSEACGWVCGAISTPLFVVCAQLRERVGVEGIAELAFEPD